MVRGFLLLVPLLIRAEDVAVGVHSGYISDIRPATFHLRTVQGKEFTCTYDFRTWFEQSRLRVPATAFQPTDLVEVVADRRLIEGRPCYIRTVRLADPTPKETSRMRITYRGVTTNWYPRGEFQWGGVVSEVNGTHLVLRTRAEGYKPLLLRRDTRFLEDGVVSDVTRLKPNEHISVRAGKNFEGTLEVYQVVWGNVTGVQ
ncbi:MAG: hypothetical protein FJW30_21830 [Acidobacteria bacterium]|nr:hypothetical protein [Acidobacteriota bacterium]